MERRNFIKSATALSAFTILKPGTVFGSKANSAIRMGIIGCGNRGMADISSLLNNSHVNIVAMADIFGVQFQSARLKKNQHNAATGFTDNEMTYNYLGT